MTHLRSFVGLVAQAALVVLVLWSIGAMAGVVYVGFCMVAGCRG